MHSGTTERPAASQTSFALHVDLGIVTVPDDYDHGTWLEKFRTQHSGDFEFFDTDIRDEHFPQPSYKLSPGSMFRACVFEQVVSRPTGIYERMDYLRAQGVVFTGAQGAALVWKQKRNLLPRRQSFLSLDTPDRLWLDRYEYTVIPALVATPEGDFKFLLDDWGPAQDAGKAMIGFIPAA